jgi:2-(1,2-epoxy-1,2-dihydrophenyl)acetyl-CoA isomerase
MGLVNRALPREMLLDFTYEYASRLARDVAPSSLAATKLQLYRDLHRDVASSVGAAGEMMSEMMGGADFAEGVAALTEKRPPVFGDRTG